MNQLAAPPPFNPLGPEGDAQARLLYRYGGDPTMAMLAMLRELGYRGSTFGNPYMTSMLGAAPGLQNAFLIQQAMAPGGSPEGAVDQGAASAQAFSDYLRGTLGGGNVMGALAQGRQGLLPALQAAQDQDILGGGTPNPYLTSLQAAFEEGGGGGALDILSSLANPFMPTQMGRAVDTGMKRGLASALYNYSETPGQFGAEGKSIYNILFPGLAARAAPPPATSTALPPPSAMPPGEVSPSVGGAPPAAVGGPSAITGQPSRQSPWLGLAPAGQAAGVESTMNQALAQTAGPRAEGQLLPQAVGSVYGGGETNPLARLADMANPTKMQQGVIDLLKEQKRRLGFGQTRS